MNEDDDVIQSETKGLIFICLFVLLTISLFTFNIDQPRDNWLGLIGYGMGYAMNYLFGIMSIPACLIFGWTGWNLLQGKYLDEFKKELVCLSIALVSVCFLLNLFADLDPNIPSFLKTKIITQKLKLSAGSVKNIFRHNLGGVLSYFIYKDIPYVNIKNLLGEMGTSITFSLSFIVSLLVLTQTSIMPFVDNTMDLVKKFFSIRFKRREKSEHDDDEEEEESEEEEEAVDLEEIEASLKTPSLKAPYIPDLGLDEITKNVMIKQVPKLRKLATIKTTVRNGYSIPPASLLRNPKKIDAPTLKKDLKKQADVLEDTLKSFGIDAKVGDIHSGPTITSLEVHPAVGVKVQKIKTLENDIALKLEAKSIRIIAPIPGKAAVGVEIPSLNPQEVSFKELLSFYQTGQKKCHIPVLLGKTVSGECVISDLTKMPHCIIAGATGSGKSVCINTIVMSILMNATPDEVKLLMVDPKKVELTSYTKLPHLIAPVITEAHGAYAALNWLVKEMELRYELLKQLGLRNIHAFNSRQMKPELEASLSIPVPEKMFAIVAIIDEFADLMMASSSDLETPIARIAQMARAVGIHLILATQRPSREVITGLIKANFPTRIAFKVASRINSQIILDDVGAESLLGNGDLLFLPPGSSQLMRAQGAYISDDEINAVIDYISKQAGPEYLIPSFDDMKKEDGFDEDDSNKDALYDEAYNIVVESKNASTTFLQRKLKIGYARAASLMDALEERGVISAQEGAKPRRVLVDSALKKQLKKDDVEEF
jgi:DNA segregation ATPase FtsK/SpoIIIE, S-DNA-T family